MDAHSSLITQLTELARDQLVTQHSAAMRDLATLGFAVIALNSTRVELMEQTLLSVGEIDPECHAIFGSSLFSVSDGKSTLQQYNKLLQSDGGVRTQLILAHASGRQRRLTAFFPGVSQVQRESRASLLPVFSLCFRANATASTDGRSAWRVCL